MQKNLLTVNYHNDAFTSGGFPQVRAGNVTLQGDVYYVDGAKLTDVGLAIPAAGAPSPAGVLPSATAIDPKTGKPNALDAAINKFIADRQKNQPLTISAKKDHLAQVTWDADAKGDGGVGKTRGKTRSLVADFKTP